MRLRETVIDGRPSTVFRRALEQGPWPLEGVWGATAQHAQIAEATGFGHFGISGSATSTHLYGLPDAGLVSLAELVENVRRVCQAVSIPVIVDCDTGFGNAINAYRTVDAVIRAGAAALFLEDQVAPKRCGFVKGKQIIPLDEAAGKYRAACDARDALDPDVVIMARTDARGAVGGSLDEVMRRGRAYLEAGADVLYVEALQTRDEIRAVREAFPDTPLKITTFAIDPPLSTEELKDLRICTTSLHIGRIAQVAMYDFLTDYRVRGADAYNEFAARTKDHPLGGFGHFNLTGFPRIQEMEQKYLPAETLERYDQTLGLYDPRRSQP